MTGLTDARNATESLLIAGFAGDIAISYSCSSRLLDTGLYPAWFGDGLPGITRICRTARSFPIK
jgi:hypothetical protein